MGKHKGGVVMVSNSIRSILKQWKIFNPNIKYDERLKCFTDWSDEKLNKIPTNREIVLHVDGDDVLCRVKSRTLVGDDVLVEIIRFL